jgi:hypothetical protein
VDSLFYRNDPRASSRGEKERPARILAKLVTEDAEAPRRIAEATRGLSREETVNEISPEGFVLAMRGLGWLQEESSHVG